MASRDDRVVLRPEGLYCPVGDFHIAPWRPVARAVVTHAHGNHPRPGMGRYHCTPQTLPLLRWRLGEAVIDAHKHGQPFRLGGMEVSLHPAGHVRGSTLGRISDGRQLWVASGDYKRQPDPTCLPFQPLRCDTFITAATFALPVYRWPDTAGVAAEILQWRAECEARGEAAVLLCCAPGKAQRRLAELQRLGAPTAWLHGAVANGMQAYRDAGVAPPGCEAVAGQGRLADAAGRRVLAPPSVAGGSWLRRFGRWQLGFASGWMRLRGNWRRRNLDRGFVVSDHADWPALAAGRRPAPGQGRHLPPRRHRPAARRHRRGPGAAGCVVAAAAGRRAVDTRRHAARAGGNHGTVAGAMAAIPQPPRRRRHAPGTRQPRPCRARRGTGHRTARRQRAAAAVRVRPRPAARPARHRHRRPPAPGRTAAGHAAALAGVPAARRTDRAARVLALHRRPGSVRPAPGQRVLACVEGQAIALPLP